MYRDTDTVKAENTESLISVFEGKNCDVLCVYAFGNEPKLKIKLSGQYESAVQYFGENCEKTAVLNDKELEIDNKTSIVLLK